MSNNINHRPYETTVEDALFMFNAGESDPDQIAKRMGMKRDTIETAFRRTGRRVPWIEAQARS